MLKWVSDNSDAISAVSNLAMLFVWIAYLQVFLQSYRRQVRPNIVINRAAGSALNASCFVGNMSSESIYIESVIVTLNCEGHDIRDTVTDSKELDGDERPDDPRQRTLQGPLRPGDYTSIGAFDELIEKVHRNKGRRDHPKAAGVPIFLEVLVIADYSSDDLLIGAKRAFTIEPKGQDWHVRGMTAKTQQIRSRRERRRIKDVVD
ncbi:hypothetical protein [Pelagibacterium luteolum]|uniref:Uncharacterized protein n=1 Tax=Pelagibacterium luteolum TaxID=440168 RepID=A0A1G8AS54_9HYPH|nr:hypothetical protein [Pelagibacterium luteolum]SDH23831.1 hypothetical protein SAMN04487974_1392 [Pelagibacterium luteolum]